MKWTLFFLFTLILPATIFAKESPDIVFKSRIDPQSSRAFMNRLRSFLVHNQFGDPFSQTIPTPIVLNLREALDQLPPRTRAWISELQTLLRLQFFDSTFRLVINDFSYSLTEFNSELKPEDLGQDRIEYVTLNRMSGLKIKARDITLQVELKRTNNREPIKFDIQLVGPELLADPEVMVDLPLAWSTSLMPDHLFFSLHTIDLSKALTKIINNPEVLELKLRDFVMPDVSFRIGTRVVRLDKEKIKKFLFERKEEMRDALLEALRVRMADFTNILSDAPQDLLMPRSFTLKGEINSLFEFKKMEAFKNIGVVKLQMDGHFCAIEEELKEKCPNSQLPTRLRREIDDRTFERSMEEINHEFSRKRANLVLSVSEHYLNQLITAAAQSGVLELSGENFKLGPERAFILADEKGTNFSLYLDIIHKLTGRRRVLVGRSELRFPVKLRIGLKTLEQNGFPHLQITVNGINTSDEILWNGLPQYGLKSNVNTVRFRKKVIKAIQEDIKEFDQRILVDLELKEFKGTYLEELSFHSDGLGRANAVLNLSGKTE